MSKSRKKGEKTKHIHVDKHANKRPTHKDAWRKNEAPGQVNVTELLNFVRSYNPKSKGR